MKKDENWDEFFMDDNTKELRQIFQGQSAMHDVIRDLNRKMDEIIGTDQFISGLYDVQTSINPAVRGRVLESSLYNLSLLPH